jgi:dimethylamine monooxygenase subunit A
MTLADLFPDEDYRFHMRFARGSVEEFFRPTPQNGDILAQRRHWLDTAPGVCAAVLPEGAPLLDEARALARQQGTTPRAAFDHGTPPDPWLRCVQLGKVWEPDFLLLKADASGSVRLLAGCVCFPSSWSLAEKIGKPIEIIHDVVPGLNASIGDQIQTFLTRLRPGTAWLRANWGLSRSPELNQHPDRRLPRLDAAVTPDEVWLRVEYQALAALPQSQGVLFGIRIAVHSLCEIRANAEIAPRLARALRTMPEPVAQYKGIAKARAGVLKLLESA